MTVFWGTILGFFLVLLVSSLCRPLTARSSPTKKAPAFWRREESILCTCTWWPHNGGALPSSTASRFPQPSDYPYQHCLTARRRAAQCECGSRETAIRNAIATSAAHSLLPFSANSSRTDQRSEYWALDALSTHTLSHDEFSGVICFGTGNVQPTQHYCSIISLPIVRPRQANGWAAVSFVPIALAYDYLQPGPSQVAAMPPSGRLVGHRTAYLRGKVNRVAPPFGQR
ncbi:hypothetical protein LY78DRAFT_4921 [Colletotrichum sublineola]|nr:hypothetical protein LY78DRAFT_4921 [Colletotrichum sublineola]